MTGRARIAVALSLAASVMPALAQAEAQTGSGSLIKDGEVPGLYLLYTGDVIGYVEPCG